MQRIKVWNIDKNEVSFEYGTRKKTTKSIRCEVADLIKARYGCVFVQGEMSFEHPETSTFAKGGTLWWVNKTGRYQYEIG